MSDIWYGKGKGYFQLVVLIKLWMMEKLVSTLTHEFEFPDFLWTLYVWNALDLNELKSWNLNKFARSISNHLNTFCFECAVLNHILIKYSFPVLLLTDSCGTTGQLVHFAPANLLPISQSMTVYTVMKVQPWSRTMIQLICQQQTWTEYLDFYQNDQNQTRHHVCVK